MITTDYKVGAHSKNTIDSHKLAYGGMSLAHQHHSWHDDNFLIRTFFGQLDAAN